MQRLSAIARGVRVSASFALALLLAACASTPPGDPAWPLSTRDLPTPIVLQQQLRIERGAEAREFEALLEADAEGLDLAVLAMGQEALRLHWNGRRLEERRARWLPPQVEGARVLQDLQFALWPLEALQRAAPRGWRVEESGAHRRVWQGKVLVADIDRGDAAAIRISRPLAGYALDIRSVTAQADTP